MIPWIKHFIAKDGPTLVAKVEYNKEQARKHNDLVKHYQDIMKENGKTIQELEEYIIQELNALQVDMTDQELHSFKKCVLMNKVIERPVLETTLDTKNYYEIGLSNKAKQMLHEGYELDCIAYCFPNYKRNEDIPVLQIERINEFRTMTGGGQWTRKLWDEITIAYGVFNKDIESVTPRFLEYIYAIEARKKGYD